MKQKFLLLAALAGGGVFWAHRRNNCRMVGLKKVGLTANLILVKTMKLTMLDKLLIRGESLMFQVQN